MAQPRNDLAPRAFAGHAFAAPALLDQALTHRSAGSPHNERLEFLGDALVNQFIAEALYRHWPKADEGALTRARAELVRESALAGLARELKLGEHLVLGPGEMKTGGHRRDSILADALEALVAAIHLVGQPGITRTEPRAVSYIHLMFDRHEIVLADGAWSESFQPGQATLEGLDQPQRDELLALFPNLVEWNAYPAARLALKAREAQVLLAA